MNNEADRSGTLDRRAFLGTASASLALMGVPVQAAILSNAGKDLEVGTPGNIDKQPSVFLTRDGRVTATMIRPVEPTVLSRMAEERITSFVKRHANLVLPSLEGSTTLSARPDTNLLVLGTPKSNPLVAKWVEEYRIELEQAGTGICTPYLESSQWNLLRSDRLQLGQGSLSRSDAFNRVLAKGGSQFSCIPCAEFGCPARHPSARNL